MATIKAAKVRAGSKLSPAEEIKVSLSKKRIYHLAKAIKHKRDEPGTPVPDIYPGVKNMFAGKYTLKELEKLLKKEESWKKVLFEKVALP